MSTKLYENSVAGQLALSFIPQAEMLFRNRKTKEVTFRGKFELPIHRWFRMTASFSPMLVKDLLGYFQLKQGAMVLDPFCGVATVPLSCSQFGYPACAVEINPFFRFVATVKTRRYSDVNAMRESVDEFLLALADEIKISCRLTPEDFFSAHPGLMPKISNVPRWWSAPVLKQLLITKKVLRGLKDLPAEHRDFVALAIASLLVQVSNARYDHVSVTFNERGQEVNIQKLLTDRLNMMLEDLESVDLEKSADVQVVGGDSRHLDQVLPRDFKAQAVITSPPYPNRFSYARETRPHLFFLDLVDSATEVTDIELQTIGGTWGRATSVLDNGIKPANSFLAKLLSPTTEKIRPKGHLMANYVIKYYNEMLLHARSLLHHVESGGRLAYVIGNSKFYGIEVPSDVFLGKVFEHVGVELEEIHQMRKRHSKSGLYESVVIMRKK